MKKHLHLNQHKFRAFLAAVGLLAIAALNGCVGNTERYYKKHTFPVTQIKDSTAQKVESSAKNVESSVQNMESSTPKEAKPGIFSGIGSLFSTPEGTAHRRAVKLAKAAVPRSIGKGAVYAPVATEVVNAYKTKQAVVNADSGAVVTTTSIGKNKASAATAPGATATTIVEKPGFWATVASGLNWWWLLIPAGYAVYRFRKSIPFIG